MRKNISVLLAGLALFCLIGCVPSPQVASDKDTPLLKCPFPNDPQVSRM